MNPTYTVPAPDGTELELARRLPLLPLRDVVVFPSMVTPLLVGRPASVAAVEAAMERDKLLCVIAQRSPETEEPGADDLFAVGTVIRVLQIIRTQPPESEVKIEVIRNNKIGDIIARLGERPDSGL